MLNDGKSSNFVSKAQNLYFDLDARGKPAKSVMIDQNMARRTTVARFAGNNSLPQPIVLWSRDDHPGAIQSKDKSSMPGKRQK